MTQDEKVYLALTVGVFVFCVSLLLSVVAFW